MGWTFARSLQSKPGLVEVDDEILGEIGSGFLIQSAIAGDKKVARSACQQNLQVARFCR